MKMSWGSLALHMEDSEPVGDIMRLLRLDEKLVIGNWGIKAEPSRLFPEHGRYMQIEIRGQRSKAKIGKKNTKFSTGNFSNNKKANRTPEEITR